MKKNNNFKATYTPPSGTSGGAGSAAEFESAVSFTEDGRKVIKFYGERNSYGCFSNFSRHPFLLHDKQWPVRPPPLPPPPLTIVIFKFSILVISIFNK
jgi:hypothetical protein